MSFVPYGQVKKSYHGRKNIMFNIFIVMALSQLLALAIRQINWVGYLMALVAYPQSAPAQRRAPDNMLGSFQPIRNAYI